MNRVAHGGEKMGQSGHVFLPNSAKEPVENVLYATGCVFGWPDPLGPVDLTSFFDQKTHPVFE